MIFLENCVHCKSMITPLKEKILESFLVLDLLSLTLNVYKTFISLSYTLALIMKISHGLALITLNLKNY